MSTVGMFCHFSAVKFVIIHLIIFISMFHAPSAVGEPWNFAWGG